VKSRNKAALLYSEYELSWRPARTAPAGERRHERRRPEQTALATLIGRSSIVAAILTRLTLLSLFLFYLGRAFDSARQNVRYKRGCRPSEIHHFLDKLPDNVILGLLLGQANFFLFHF
jgi:hypothetical protein